MVFYTNISFQQGKESARKIAIVSLIGKEIECNQNSSNIVSSYLQYDQREYIRDTRFCLQVIGGSSYLASAYQKECFNWTVILTPMQCVFAQSYLKSYTRPMYLC